MNPASESPNDRIWSREICARENIVDRSLRQWVAKDRFPPPDGNLNGRNFWLRSTYDQWRADVAAGKYAQTRRPNPTARKAA